MRLRVGLFALLAFGVTPAMAGSQHILVGLDETSYWGPKGQGYHAQGPDSVVILDASDSAHPRIAAHLPMINSVLGPPVNLQITPDGSLGLVTAAAAVAQDKKGVWNPGPGNIVHVIDMTTLKPVGNVKVGLMPEGVAISHDGKLALIANHVGDSISVLRIAGKTVTPIAEVPIGASVSAVAIAPDGKRAFAIKDTSDLVAVLTIQGEHVTYNPKMDIPTGYKPYNIAITPDGETVLANSGGRPGSTAAFTVIAAKGPHPHATQIVDVGDAAEGFMIAPDGSSAALALLNGSAGAYDSWSYHANGNVELLALKNGKARRLPKIVAVGAVPEAIAYSPDSKYVYAGGYNEQQLHVLKVTPDGLSDTGVVVKLPGHPASMRGLAN